MLLIFERKKTTNSHPSTPIDSSKESFPLYCTSNPQAPASFTEYVPLYFSGEKEKGRTTRHDMWSIKRTMEKNGKSRLALLSTLRKPDVNNIPVL
jgi:hypothetical protein